MKETRMVYEGGEGELVEKKSRFIATVKPVTAEEEALDFIAAMKKKYWNASHNCFAYVIGENQQLQRCSDDGEPQGTAGRPMLDILLGEDIHNTVVVVTRYFGGTLLGTGGLVRAYSRSVQEGLKNSTIITKKTGALLKIRTDYNGIGKIQYILGKNGHTITASEYTDVVTLETLIPENEIIRIREELTEATQGKAEFLQQEEVCFAFLDGEPILF